MRTYVVGGLCGALMAALMIHSGHSLIAWEFWSAMILMLVYGVNLGID